jgi:hypothetical protein
MCDLRCVMYDFIKIEKYPGSFIIRTRRRFSSLSEGEGLG